MHAFIYRQYIVHWPGYAVNLLLQGAVPESLLTKDRFVQLITVMSRSVFYAPGLKKHYYFLQSAFSTFLLELLFKEVKPREDIMRKYVIEKMHMQSKDPLS